MNANLCDKCRSINICRRMANSIKRIFYCFTYYDKQDKKRYKSNNGCLYSARYYRNEILSDKERFSEVSDIFVDSLEV